MRRFNVNETSGELRFELEAAFGPEAELVDLTEDLKKAARREKEAEKATNVGYEMFCLPCDKIVEPVMIDHWDAPECPDCGSISLD
jgi:hypothetical protein